MIEEKTYLEAKKVVQSYEQQLKQAPVDCWAFNINDRVLVKLKDEGFKYWLEYYNKYLPDSMKLSIDELKAKADKEGYIEFQLWNFMKIFGETISFGKQPIFETTMRFYKDEMKPCS
jgi:hypothetical protein